MTERVNKYSSLRLQAEALCCERGGREVFRDIAFSAGSGQLLAVTGPNGAGKSSLLRIVAGLLSPSAGRVSVETGDHDADPAASVHYLGHLDGLKSAMSLRENLAFWNRIYCGTADPGAIAAAAGRLGLAHALDLPVGVFSAGQRRRAVLARITLSPRPLWLLDEPTSALDEDGEAALGDLMREHLVTGGVIVAATHLDLPVWPDLSLRMAVPE